MKTHWKKLINPDYLGAYSLPEGKDLKVKIKEVLREEVTGPKGRKEECTVAHLEGHKPMILNRTNCKMIKENFGTPYIEDWAGGEITLYAASVEFQGETVEALRIRREKKLPELKKGSATFKKAKAAFDAGQVTLDQIKTKYTVDEKDFQN